jgi:hypothetical protein
MAKSKHTINDIQKALLSSTKFIKENEVAKPEINNDQQDSKPSTTDLNIDPVVMKKFKILAPYMGETTEELINKALNHFLRLKSMQLEQAMQKLTEE